VTFANKVKVREFTGKAKKKRSKSKKRASRNQDTPSAFGQQSDAPTAATSQQLAN